MTRSARRPASGPAAESAPRALEPRTWQGVVYRPCQAGASAVRGLFQFAGAWAPPPTAQELAWEALAEDRVVGGILVEVADPDGFVHGPVVVSPPTGSEPLEVAAHLVAALLGHAGDVPLNTLFTRPQGLDRVWVRSGFVPVPEATLPEGLRGRPGTGLHAWRRPGTYEVAMPEAEGARSRARR